MSPVFIFLVILGGILLWFLLSGAFRVIGYIGNYLFDNAKNNMFYEEVEENKKEVKKYNEEK